MKRTLILGVIAGVLVVGAIFGGVFGARAVEKKRRVPIPVEAVTYSMVAQGFAKGAVVPVPKTYKKGAAANSSVTATTKATTKATTTADKAPAGTGLGGEHSVFSYEYWFGEGGIGAIPMFDPMPLVLPPDAVTVPTWSAAFANGNFANTQGRVICYAKTGQEVIDMVSGDESACEVIILTNDRFTPYSIHTVMNVTKSKLIIGRPIYAPMLNSTNRVERLFDGKSFMRCFLILLTRINNPHVAYQFIFGGCTVLPGGRLETRNVIMVRGFGRNLGINGNEINLVVGSIARVHAGGQFSAVT